MARTLHYIVGIGALVLANVSHAAYSNGKYISTSTGVKTVEDFGKSIGLNATVETTGANLPAKYNTVRAALTARSLARAARFAVGGPLGAAIIAATILDDIINIRDPDTGKQDLGYPAKTLPPEEDECLSMVNPGYSNPTNINAWKNLEPGSCTWVYRSGADYNWYKVEVGRVNYQQTEGMTYEDFCPSGFTKCTFGLDSSRYVVYQMVPELNEPYETPARLATDEEINTAFYDHAGYDLARDVIKEYLLNNRNDYINDNTSQYKQILDEVMLAHNNALEGGEQVASDVEIQNNASESYYPLIDSEVKVEIPTNCDLLPVLCEIKDWLFSTEGLPENPEVPIEDYGEETYDSGLGGGSCPSPIPWSLQGQTGEYSFQIACDWAPAFRALLITIASILAAYILLGRGARA